MAKRLGEAVGKPGERSGLFEIWANAPRAVVRHLRLVGPLLAGDLLRCPRTPRVGSWLISHDQMIVDLPTDPHGTGHLAFQAYGLEATARSK